MYICKDCGEIFEEPVVVKDDPSPDGVGLTSGYYVFESCPHCDSDNIEEAVQCVCCDEWMDGTDGSDILCDNCLAEIKDTLDGIMADYNLSDDDFENVLAELGY